MSDDGGTIRDIRTGVELGKTASMDDTLIEQVGELLARGCDILVVLGPDEDKRLRARLEAAGLAGRLIMVDDRAMGLALVLEGGPEDAPPHA